MAFGYVRQSGAHLQPRDNFVALISLTGNGRASARVPDMPPTKTKLRRAFDSSLAAYLEAIQSTKTALLAVTNEPSKATKTEFTNASLQEKEARRVYRKATKKLHALARNG